jgi:hypothetical protein
VVAALIGTNDVASDLALVTDGVFVFVAGIAILAAIGLPRWLGWTALIAGVALVTGATGNNIGQLAALIWFIACGVWMLRHQPIEQPDSAAAGIHAMAG